MGTEELALEDKDEFKPKHPVKCECGGNLHAVFTIVRERPVNDDGSLGDWTDGGCSDLGYYQCTKCEETIEEDA